DVAERFGHLLSVLAEDEALIDELLEGFRRAEMPEIEEDFVPEAGVEEVQDGMLGPTDIEVHRAGFVAAAEPVSLGLFADKTVRISRVAVAQIIPARARPLGHRIRLALRGGAIGDPVGRFDER